MAALGLIQERNGAPRHVDAVVELTHAATPMQVSEAGLNVITRLERSWPHMGMHEDDLEILAAESPSLRHALLTRLAEEAQPPAHLFHILPWELVQELADDLSHAIDVGGEASNVRLAHWFTPTGSLFAGAMDRMNHRLRRAGPADLVEHGGRKLGDLLAEADRARFPPAALDSLGRLMRSLIGLDLTLRERVPPEMVAAPVALDNGDVARIIESWLRDMPTVGLGEFVHEREGVRIRLVVTARADDGGELLLEVTPPVSDVPVRVRSGSRQINVTQLDRITDGRMRVDLAYPPPYEMLLAKGLRRDGVRTEFYEMATIEPQWFETPVASDEDAPGSELLLLVPRLQLQVNVYESGDGRLVISAAASSPNAAGRYLQIALHRLNDESSQTCVIPLNWVYDAAEGALSVGVWHERITIGLTLELISDPSSLDPAAVRWSAAHAEDEGTAASLRALLATNGEDE
ncbi:hypothetical protein ACFHW2_40905 [Actinomadura sp. LOL_016]|uniref:hypothetical protein n=1 Tax=unclassified Actinomadura TaxID=2626254 RepID=UPI003A801CFE